MWLVRELKRVHQVRATYCYGTVLSSAGAVGNQTPHSWVEVTRSDVPDRLVIDLGLGGEPILCEDFQSLASRGVRYQASGYSTIDELPGRGVWSHFEALDDALYAEEVSHIL